MYHNRQHISSWSVKEEKGKRSNRQFVFTLIIIYMILLIVLLVIFIVARESMKNQAAQRIILPIKISMETKEEKKPVVLPAEEEKRGLKTAFTEKEKEKRKTATVIKENNEEADAATSVEEKIMYLTFDDGPHKTNTAKVLDILKRRNVKATFFLIGEYVEKYPELAKRIVIEGHGIGVHCYRHDYSQLYGQVKNYMEDFEKAHEIIKEITGEDTKIYRFPGGSINDFNKDVREEIIREMTERGYIYYDWNASLEDATKNPKAEKLIQNALSTTLGRKKVIMLAHDTVHETAECLDTLLDHFPEYKMEILTEEIEPIQF